MVCDIRGAEVATSRLLLCCVPFVWFVYSVVEPNPSGLAKMGGLGPQSAVLVHGCADL